MFPGHRKRGWRQCMADSYEKEYGALDDPVPTFGAKLVTFPSTPTLSSDLAGPDIEFLEQLDKHLCAIAHDPVPKCLQGLRFFDPEEEQEADEIYLSYSDSETDDEDAGESLCDFAIRMYWKQGIDIVAVLAERRKRKRQAKEEACKQGSASNPKHTKFTPPLSGNKAGLDTEAEAAKCQPSRQKRKRHTEDAQPRKMAKPNDTANARPKRQTQLRRKAQASYSPPQTPSPTDREYAQEQASRKSPVAQQPTPEVDNSPCCSKRGRSGESPLSGAG
ncbi:hypothetical protein FOPG_18674 [Fusarium oxysporum f. sp. conglutinans race 2 54008]|uniref:Uncharacterized protein n=1 Tax=Fusarium oxysporum f. sp. conglutinans race 2 54008 TaxID=1089457 RepID=X0HV88_FUSOX|nr:hypothetical protein FOPG_18674 [Fusarium oxysporum f. sp. conglutinans race 2 54008]KAG6989186.1 hypothetical protein FocnCong_v021294 [Fusarium oxysporum f. sp. conglutinans]